MSSSDGDGNIGSSAFRRPTELCGVLGVNIILGSGVLGDEAAVLLGEENIGNALVFGEENDGTLRSASSLLMLLLLDDGGGFLGESTKSSSLSSALLSSENNNEAPPP